MPEQKSASDYGEGMSESVALGQILTRDKSGAKFNIVTTLV